jgi:transcription elongation factor Elf1
MIGRMIDTEDHRCPTCGSTDLVVIDTKAIADELLECRGCKSIYQMESQPDGSTRLVRM